MGSFNPALATYTEADGAGQTGEGASFCPEFSLHSVLSSYYSPGYSMAATVVASIAIQCKAFSRQLWLSHRRLPPPPPLPRPLHHLPHIRLLPGRPLRGRPRPPLRTPSPDVALCLFRSLRSDPSFTVTHHALHALAKTLSASRRVGDLRSLLDAADSGSFPRLLAPSPMDRLRWYAAAGDVPSALRAWEGIRAAVAIDKRRHPCTESYNLVMGLYVTAGMDAEAVEVFRKMVEEGANPNSRTYTVIMEHIVWAGKLENARQAHVEAVQCGKKEELFFAQEPTTGKPFVFPDMGVDEQIFRALAYIYGALGVCHRDIKPQNVRIAQVDGTTLRNGQEVVVKVQHEGIKQVILEDLKNVKSIIDWIARAEAKFIFNPLIDEWCKEAPKELDFNMEAGTRHHMAGRSCSSTVRRFKLRLDIPKEAMDACNNVIFRATTPANEAL
ncbi:hypothetical protein Taro_030964, partial [Colocasia esculenta]|nr:hypothetical protein [Colocasia esculenta]